MVEAIALAYSSQGLLPPGGLRAHSSRGGAYILGLVQDICVVASWYLPLTYVRHYMLDVSALSMAQAVLQSSLEQATLLDGW